MNESPFLFLFMPIVAIIDVCSALKRWGTPLKKIHALPLFVMLVWGLNVSALKVLVTSIDPIFLTALRIFTAGIAVLILTKMFGIFRWPTKRELGMIAYISIFNVILHHIFLALGLANTSGVNTGLILGANPLVVLMLSMLLLKSGFSRAKVIGFILGFVGIVVTSLAGSDGLTAFSLGDAMILISMLAQAFSFILISKLNPSFDPRLLTGYMLVFGSLVIFIVSLLFDANFAQVTMLFSWKLGSLFLFSALICTAVGHMIYNYAIKQVGPAESAVFVNLNTLFALTGAAIFLGEPILLGHIIGFIFILCGVFFGSGAFESMYKKQSNVS